MKLYELIANLGEAIRNCVVNQVNKEIYLNHRDTLEKVTDNLLPSGNGIDAGTRILNVSKREIKLRADYHHMDENGFYDGWTEHIITVKPSLIGGIEIKVSGLNRNGIKDYLADLFYDVLTSEVVRDENGVRFADQAL